MEQVFIFKTNVSTQDHVRKVSALFAAIAGIRQWNFDLDDCDKILRVIATNLSPDRIENLLKREHIYCENLEYEL